MFSENVTGFCRALRSFVTLALENIALWHKGDINHSSVEGSVLPDAFVTTDFMLVRLTNLVEKLLIYPQNMVKNLSLTGGLVFSQRMLLEFLFRGLSREEAYETVQRNTTRVWRDLQEGRSALNEKSESLSLPALPDSEDLEARLGEEDIRKHFDYAYYTKSIGSIFNRVFK